MAVWVFMANRNVPETYLTIASAVAAASAGDTIKVVAGYAGDESVFVTVDNLTFNAPSTVTGIALAAGAGVATIRLAGNSDIQVTGNGAANVIVGNSGNNAFVGGAGNDNLDGGAGIDTVSYASAPAGVTVNLLTGSAADGLSGSGETYQSRFLAPRIGPYCLGAEPARRASASRPTQAI